MRPSSEVLSEAPLWAGGSLPTTRSRPRRSPHLYSSPWSGRLWPGAPGTAADEREPRIGLLRRRRIGGGRGICLDVEAGLDPRAGWGSPYVRRRRNGIRRRVAFCGGARRWLAAAGSRGRCSAFSRGPGRGRAGSRAGRTGGHSLSLLVAAGDILTQAAGAASGSRGGFRFDPFTALPWSVPVMVIAPLAAFVMAVSGVRTRRSASNLSIFGAVVSLAATLLAGWGLINKTAQFRFSYFYLNVLVLFNRLTNFQSYENDIVLRVD